jgi:hypothetical protein
MATSRSAVTFLGRAGLHPNLPAPVPRLAPGALLVTSVPLDQPAPSQETLLAYEGEPPPDRGETKPWPDHRVQET